MRRSGLLWLLCAVLAAGTVLAADTAGSADRPGAAGRTPVPVIERAQAGTQCVEPPAVMRRSHMDLLKHQRDDTVRGGIRGASHSLKGCIACHASPASRSVAQTETNFCVSCHSYAAVKIDCFDCHTAKPGVVATGAAR